MPSRNATTLLATYDAVNRRDLDAVYADVADDFVGIDHAQRRSLVGVEASRAWMQEMFEASSDLRCEATLVADTSEVVVVRVVGEGTHDGPFGPLPATGRRFRVEQCEVYAFDEQGRIVRGEMFYDMYGVLADLGAVPALTA